MTTLQERLKWILAHRGFTQRGLSLAAGRSQSHVGQLIRGKVGSQVSADLLSDIARAARVSLVWLQTGEGSPDLPAEAELAPNRAQAAELAREDGVYEAAIQSVLAEHVAPTDVARSRVWWVMKMKLREVEILGSSTGSRPVVIPIAAAAPTPRSPPDDPTPLTRRVRSK